jgi:hypothetical protein
MANFSTAAKVLQTIRFTDDSAAIQSENRGKINKHANCWPPFDQDFADKNNVKINVNFGELMELLAEARRQYMLAFWGQSQFFKVTIPEAPMEVQSEWGELVSEAINSVMRESLEYFELHRSKWAAVVSHGIGPSVWWDQEGWCPSYLAINDLRIPTDTTSDCKNLDWYGVRRIFTPFELAAEALDHPAANNKWDTKAVAKILKQYKESNTEFASLKYDVETDTEKFIELMKQDGGYYSSSAVPGIPLWYFYFKDITPADPAKRGWYQVVVPDTGVRQDGRDPDKFLWKSDSPICGKLSRLMHLQLGDLNNDSPFKIQAIRSLGFALLEPCFYNNLTICRAVQHLHDNFNTWLRVNDPPDKARAQLQEFYNMCVIRPGVSVVPSAERHQVDSRMIEMVMGIMKQLQQEKSSSYTQQADTGTRKEQTAFETRVKLEKVNAMTGGLLLNAFIYETHSYREIARRFCNPSPSVSDPDILKVRGKLRRIPPDWLTVEKWHIEPVTPLGMGNPTIAQAAAEQLMQIRPACNPTAQQEILHEKILVTTGDPRKAARWAPIGKRPGMSDSVRDAQAIFGTLMQGVMVPPRDEFSPIEQCATLLPMLGQVVQKYSQRNNMATDEEVKGMTTVAQYIVTQIQRLEMDPSQKPVVKQFSDQIGKLLNLIRALAQRGQLAKQKAMQQQNNGEMAKQQQEMAMEQARLRMDAAKNQQAMRHKEISFAADERRKNLSLAADTARQNFATVENNRVKGLKE